MSSNSEDEPVTNKTWQERFWEKVNKTDSCWLWTGQIMPKGYGQCWVREGDSRQKKLVHRVAYELLVGPIPVGMTLDHVRSKGCTNKHCVWPEHLEPVTNKENNQRGNSVTAQNVRKIVCPYGHPYSGPNLRVNTYGHRICRACEKISNKSRKLAKKVA